MRLEPTPRSFFLLFLWAEMCKGLLIRSQETRWHCQRKVARTEFSTDDRELGRPELTPLGECGGAVELEIVS